MPCPNCHCPSCLALVGSPIPSTEFSLPPSELTTANRAPTNSEVAYSRAVIGSSEKMISLIQGMVDDLENRKAELLGLIGTHKAAISPLRSFPPELLVEIFTHAVEDHWSSTCPPPLMLMGICSWWRRIVLDTPRLWTKVVSPHPMIDSWITRSRELPLHLGLDISRPVSHPILEALIPHSHRWESVGFCLGPSSPPILARVRTHLHSLKRLSLSFGETTGTMDFFEVAPQLTHIMLTNVFEPIIVKLPREQLRVCVVDSSEVAHYVLQNAENLRGLYLDMSKTSDVPSFQPREPHTHHPRLKNLIIEWKFVDPDINSFFSSITLPSLQILEICFDYADPEDSFDPAEADADRTALAPILAAFFERSCARLSTLKLIDIPFSQSGLIKCLAFTPSLVSLDIQFDSRWHAIDKKLLGRLDANHPKQILPHLISLALRGPMDILAGGSLDALVASRRRIDPKHDGVALLENLILGDCPRPGFMSRPPQFHRFVSEGLNITYGKDWGINGSQADHSPPLEEQT